MISCTPFSTQHSSGANPMMLVLSSVLVLPAIPSSWGTHAPRIFPRPRERSRPICRVRWIFISPNWNMIFRIWPIQPFWAAAISMSAVESMWIHTGISSSPVIHIPPIIQLHPPYRYIFLLMLLSVQSYWVGSIQCFHRPPKV